MSISENTLRYYRNPQHFALDNENIITIGEASERHYGSYCQLQLREDHSITFQAIGCVYLIAACEALIELLGQHPKRPHRTQLIDALLIELEPVPPNRVFCLELAVEAYLQLLSKKT